MTSLPPRYEHSIIGPLAQALQAGLKSRAAQFGFLSTFLQNGPFAIEFCLQKMRAPRDLRPRECYYERSIPSSCPATEVGDAMSLSMLWTLVFYGWLASEILVGVATRTKRSGGKVQDRGSLLILWIVITASVAACQWFSETHARNMFGAAQALKTAAIIVMLAGLAIRWTAIFTLGKSFSSNVAIQDSQQITRAGPYRFVRHPSYLGLLLVFLAIGLHSRNWISFAFVLVPTTAGLLYRIHVEEAALADAFGDEYAAYCKATKRLVPGVY